MGSAILAAATLSFLGLGVNPPTPEWGAIASAGREYFRDAPYVVLFPSLAIFAVVWSLNVGGDLLRDRLDPRLRTSRARPGMIKPTLRSRALAGT
jgi:peptide/nickel transport system permease protein